MNIIEEIGHAKVIGITGHIRPDGDCVGSTLGLYNYIRKNLPECQVTVYLEKPSDEFNYLSGINDIKHEAEDKHFDLFVVLDCSSMDRIEPFMSCFENADKTICIDHPPPTQWHGQCREWSPPAGWKWWTAARPWP